LNRTGASAPQVIQFIIHASTYGPDYKFET